MYWLSPKLWCQAQWYSPHTSKCGLLLHQQLPSLCKTITCLVQSNMQDGQTNYFLARSGRNAQQTNLKLLYVAFPSTAIPTSVDTHSYAQATRSNPSETHAFASSSSSHAALSSSTVMPTPLQIDHSLPTQQATSTIKTQNASASR